MGKRTIRRIIGILYVLAVIPLVASYLSMWISPAKFWPLAFFGLSFPVLIVVQFFFLILFIVMRSKLLVIPMVLILGAWGALANTFQLPLGRASLPPGKEPITVMTYNVRLFDLFKWSGVKDQSDHIFSYVNEIDPDILCFQEFAHRNSGELTLEAVQQHLTAMPYSVIRYNYSTAVQKHGLALFSKYPIVHSDSRSFEDTHNMVMIADIVIGKDTIRFYNNHLESIHFSRDEFQWIDDKEDESRIPRQKITTIVNRLKKAYIKRSEQADFVRTSIDDSPYPVIVCGDFNDTPVSYATNRIRENLHDSFRSGGRWLGITFPNVRAPLRIDYILHSGEMKSAGHRIGKGRFSDHQPVSCEISLPPDEASE